MGKEQYLYVYLFYLAYLGSWCVCVFTFCSDVILFRFNVSRCQKHHAPDNLSLPIYPAYHEG